MTSYPEQPNFDAEFGLGLTIPFIVNLFDAGNMVPPKMDIFADLHGYL